MTEDFKDKIKNLQYKGIPVFGRDSNPQNSSEFFALAGTAFLWLIIFLFLLFAHPFAKKPEYKTVQIVLSSTPVAKTEKKESSASSAASQKAQSTEKKTETKQIKQVTENSAPAKPKTEQNQKTEAKKITETPKKAADKPAAAKSATANKTAESKPAAAAKNQAPAAPVEYAKSVEDLMAEQMSTPKKTAADFNWDNFADSSDNSSSDTQPVKVAKASSTGGTSGQSSKSDDSGVVSKAAKDGSVSETASSNTLGSLSGVRNAKFIGKAGSSHSSELTASVSNGGGKNQFSMTDGSSRALLEPSDPRIDLSEQAANLIDSTINVTIFIEVQPSGNVTGVDFNPSSIVPPLVQSEIRAQIAGKWRFERADYSSMGKFQYTIKKL